MAMHKNLYLSQYTPRSELSVEKHAVDKPRFPVIDIHTHWGTTVLGEDFESRYHTGECVSLLKQYKIKNIINLDGLWGKELERMLAKTENFNHFVITFGSIDISRLDEKDFNSYVIKTLKESKKRGVRGLKFLKSLSLEIKDSKGRYIPADDSRLKVIWETAAELKLPVLIHIADPVAFFKPVDRYNERYEELMENPEWSYCSPEYFSFDRMMEMQENLLSSNPETIFCIPHVGSNPENLSFVSSCLDSYSNMYIDIAGRIAELGRQPYTARKFFTKYQDRIMFGTDVSMSTKLFSYYPIYFRFLETMDEYFDYSLNPIPDQGRWKIYGLGLDLSVLEKVYYRNAESFLSCRRVK